MIVGPGREDDLPAITGILNETMGAPGFSETVEVAIAIGAGSRGQGAGSALYRALLDELAGEPVHVALAGIAGPMTPRWPCTAHSASPTWALFTNTPRRPAST